MTNTRMRAGRAVRDTYALIDTLGHYWLTVFPVALVELRRCRARALAIPDPVLRDHALTTLIDEQANAEGAAIFATLAPRRHRATVTRLLVRYQVMYDYLDTLTEQPARNPLANGRQLHRALTVALGGPLPLSGYYRHHSRREDGGYLSGLVAACRDDFYALPSAAEVAPVARRAARRAGECQSHNHAAMLAGDDTLMRWATSQGVAHPGVEWWEIAAAAGSSLSVHALLASAADSQTTRTSAEQINAAYWPWINGLNTLLESLIDIDADRVTSNHSYVGRYQSWQSVAERIPMFAARAVHAVRDIDMSDEHAVILTAMTSFYLSTPQAESPELRPIARSVRAELDTDPRILLAMLRARRRLAARDRSGGPAVSNTPMAV